jgi:hypothetical protein
MEVNFYWFGVFLAIFSGIAHNSGLLIEKYLINKIPVEVKVMKNLIKNPIWLLALIIRFGLGSLFSW